MDGSGQVLSFTQLSKSYNDHDVVISAPVHFLAAVPLTVFALERLGFAGGSGSPSANLSRLPIMGGCWASTSHISRIQSEI